MPKAPEWLNDDIKEFYDPNDVNIRAIQRAILEKRGVEIAYMTITERMKRLGLERPREKSKKAKGERMGDETTVEVLPGQVSLDDLDTAAPPIGEDTMSTLVDMVPVNHEVDGPLSPIELQTLEHYERIIAQGIKTFIEVGHALLGIRDQHLYRQTYGTFEDYLRERWDLSRPRAYQLIDAAQVVDTVSTSVDIVPVNEAQARPLASLPPEQQVEVWKEAVETAPPSGITAKHVQATVKQAKERTSPTTPLTAPRRGQAEDTRERMGERGQPNGSWINVLSHCNRLCSSLRRLPDLDEILESWGPEGRQKAVEYLRPLYGNVQQLLWSLKAIDAEPFVRQESSEPTTK